MLKRIWNAVWPEAFLICFCVMVSLALGIAAGRIERNANSKEAEHPRIQPKQSGVITSEIVSSKPFGEFINITPNTNHAWSFALDYEHPTNIEAIFYHEPVIVGHTNGTWIVRFKK